jgi:Phosphorylated adapter RNA export protein, RNA-binding domain
VEILGEMDVEPVPPVAEVFRVLGAGTTWRLLQKTLHTQANGGIPVWDGSRKRTTGGVFFYYARKWCTKAEAQALFGAAAQTAAPATPATPATASSNATALWPLRPRASRRYRATREPPPPGQTRRRNGSVSIITTNAAASDAAPKLASDVSG